MTYQELVEKNLNYFIQNLNKDLGIDEDSQTLNKYFESNHTGGDLKNESSNQTKKYNIIDFDYDDLEFETEDVFLNSTSLNLLKQENLKQNELIHEEEDKTDKEEDKEDPPNTVTDTILDIQEKDGEEKSKSSSESSEEKEKDPEIIVDETSLIDEILNEDKDKRTDFYQNNLKVMSNTNSEDINFETDSINKSEENSEDKSEENFEELNEYIQNYFSNLEGGKNINEIKETLNDDDIKKYNSSVTGLTGGNFQKINNNTNYKLYPYNLY